MSHDAGLTSICYAQRDGKSVLLSVGQDGKLLLRDPLKVATVLHTFDLKQPMHDVHSLQVDGKPCALVAQQDGYAKAYTLSSGEFETVCTRMVLPARVIQSSPSGDHVVVAGDDDGVKLINAKQQFKVMRTLKGAGYIRSLAYDPDLSFLAASTADGVLSVWDMQTGTQLVHRKRILPKVDPAAPRCNGIAFHPDGGSLLAAPGLAHDVVLYERLSWEESCVLEGGHDAEVDVVVFSPNGLYLVSGGLDNQLVLWDVAARKRLATHTSPAPPCSLAWDASRNTLAYADIQGGVGVWKGVVPQGLPGPGDAVDVLMPGKGVHALIDDTAAVTEEGEEEEDDGGDEDEEGEEGEEEEEGGHSGRRPGGVSDVGEGSHAAGSSPGGGRGRRRGKVVGKRRGGGGGGVMLPKVPSVVQPGATPMGEHQRRFLAYNNDGCITCKYDEEVGINILEVSFHDTSKHKKRVPLLNDFFGITMASLGGQGALYASPATDDAPSTILYKPFASWSTNCEWMMQLPRPEYTTAVAAGAHFCAVTTSAGLLRVFSEGGLQLHVMSVGGKVVAMAASEHLLAVVTVGGVQSSDAVMLQYMVLDVAREERVHQGPLPLSPNTTLTWLGFVENTPTLATQDSHGMLRVLSPQFGGSWVPVFDAQQARKGSEVFWVVGVGRGELSCVVCPAGGQPQVQPRPVVTRLPLHVPVLDGGVQDVELESTLIRESLWLHHVRQRVAHAQLAGEGVQGLEYEELTGEVAVDKLLLKLLHATLKGDRPARAYEAAARLNTTQSLEGALRLANHMRAGPLAERISKLVETRMMEDTQAAAMDLHDDDDGYDDDGGQHGGNDGQARRVISRHGGGDDEGMGGDGVEAVGGKENTSTPAVSAMALLGKGGKGNMHANTGEGVAAKRKQHVTTIGASANPFARKAKAAKT